MTSRYSRTPAARRARMDTIANVLSNEPLHVARISDLVQIPQSTVRDLLDVLELEKRAHHREIPNQSAAGITAYVWFKGPRPGSERTNPRMHNFRDYLVAAIHGPAGEVRYG